VTAFVRTDDALHGFSAVPQALLEPTSSRWRTGVSIERAGAATRHHRGHG
jgi:hypothetical protein